MSTPTLKNIPKTEIISVDVDVSFSQDAANSALNNSLNVEAKNSTETKNKSAKKAVQGKQSITYVQNRGKNGQKKQDCNGENVKIGAKSPLNCLAGIKQTMAEIDKKKAKIDALCERHLMHFLANKKVHHAIINGIQNSSSTAAYDNFIVGISATTEKYKNGEVVNLTNMAKEVAIDVDLSAKFVTEHVFPIIKTLRIFREPSVKKFRWANQVELEQMTAFVYKKYAAKSDEKVVEEKTVEELKQDDLQEDNNVNGFVGFLNDKIKKRNQASLEKRRQRALDDAARDPYKKIDENGDIHDLPKPFEGQTLSDEEKELIRKRDHAKAKADLISETAQFQNIDYAVQYQKKEATHHLAMQKEVIQAQQLLVTQNLEQQKKRSESMQQTKHGLLNLAKIGGMFVFVALMVWFISQATSSNTENSDYSITTRITTETENAPW